MKNLFLVTYEGDRHEDHIPCWFCDYQTLQQNLVNVPNENELIKNQKWYIFVDKLGVYHNVIVVRETNKIPIL